MSPMDTRSATSPTATEHFAVLLQNLDDLEHGRVDHAAFASRNAQAWDKIERAGVADQVLTLWRGWRRGAATAR